MGLGPCSGALCPAVPCSRCPAGRFIYPSPASKHMSNSCLVQRLHPQIIHFCVSRIHHLGWFSYTGKVWQGSAAVSPGRGARKEGWGGRRHHREGELQGRLLHQARLGRTMCPRGHMLSALHIEWERPILRQLLVGLQQNPFTN